MLEKSVYGILENKGQLNWISKVLRYILLSLALYYLIVYLIIVYYRINYPFELEWMEGGSVDHVIRILSGQKLYVSPSLDFIPYIYTPLYFFLTAAISKIIGINFFTLRFVSFISSLGCLYLIFLIIKKETDCIFSSIIASCLFAATFRISGAWFDIARVDSLFLLFLLAAIYIIRFNDSTKSYILAGVLISLSFLTKQTALIISLPLMLYCVYLNRRRGYFFMITVFMIIGVSTLILNYINDGWYIYYVFDLPQQHQIIKSMFVFFWIKDIILPLYFAFLISIFYIYYNILIINKKNYIFYILAAIGMLGGAWYSRLHSGGYDNVLFPAYAIISILFGLGIFSIFQFMKNEYEKKFKFIEICIYLVCIFQFISLLYNPYSLIPSQKDHEAGNEFINTISQIQGDVFIPGHAYIPILAGKKSHAQSMAIIDVLRGNDGIEKKLLIDQINQALNEKRFNAIILDSTRDYSPDDLEQNYAMQRVLFNNSTVFWPVTGYETRPEFIYVPINNSAAR